MQSTKNQSQKKTKTKKLEKFPTLTIASKQLMETRRRIDSEFIFDQYAGFYEDILNMKLQNDYLATKDGAESVGLDRAKDIIEQNKKSIKTEQGKLRFIEESLTK